MKRIIVISFLLLLGSYGFGQDTTASWMFNLNVSEYKMYYKTKNIPKEFYNIISIDKKEDIVDNDKDFKRHCVGPGVPIKLNWLAKDKNKKWVLSVSYGGRAYYTIYYCFDYDSGEMNTNAFYIRSREKDVLSFEEISTCLRKRKFEREDIDFDYKEED